MANQRSATHIVLSDFGTDSAASLTTVDTIQARIYIAQTAQAIHLRDRFFLMSYVGCCMRTAETRMPSTLINGNQGAVN